MEFEVHKSHLGFYGLVAGGNHEAGAICLPGLWKQLAIEMNDNLVVAIPAKDLLLFSPESDAAGILRMKESTAEILAIGEKLLTKTIFIIRKRLTGARCNGETWMPSNIKDTFSHP